MTVEYKSSREISRMREAGRIVAETFERLALRIRPGVTTADLDRFIHDTVVSRGGVLLFYRYRPSSSQSPFPASSCISVNDEVVHGIPRDTRRLREGDIVSIDVGVRYRNYCGDAAWTFPVGRVSRSAARLLQVGRAALDRAVAVMQPGRRLSGVARVIQDYVEGKGYSVVKKFVGHGIGRRMHEPPQVPNYVDASLLRTDIVLKPGLVLAVEPMVNEGTDEVETLDDGWTVVTKDGRLSAHFEYTVAVTPAGPEILTLWDSGRAGVPSRAARLGRQAT